MMILISLTWDKKAGDVDDFVPSDIIIDLCNRVLSSPQSEKYLKMVRVVEAARIVINKAFGEKPFIGIMDWNELANALEALKSYNSEKGGEHERD